MQGNVSVDGSMWLEKSIREQKESNNRAMLVEEMLKMVEEEMRKMLITGDTSQKTLYLDEDR